MSETQRPQVRSAHLAGLPGWGELPLGGARGAAEPFVGFTGAGSAKKRNLKNAMGFPKKFGGVPGLKGDPARGPAGPFVGFFVGFLVGFRRTSAQQGLRRNPSWDSPARGPPKNET